jgi:Protein of unknown function (DUF1168)
MTSAKTAKNRAKRQKKKDKAKMKGNGQDNDASGEHITPSSSDLLPLKKRRLINGKELVFRRPGGSSDEEEGDDEATGQPDCPLPTLVKDAPAVLETSKITIQEDD